MSISICIVEDLVEVREGLSRFIRRHPEMEVIGMFPTAEKAVEQILRLRPDIVIMDINLPGMNGIDCVREIKAKAPEIQFMMFTVYESDDKVFEALKAGASGYLLKNTGLEQMVAAIKELHEGGSPMSAGIARKVVTMFHQPPGDRKSVAVLSPRENELLQLLAEGYLYKEIADQLTITISTVRHHIHHIYEKLHVQNRTEALNKAYGSTKITDSRS